MKKIINALIKHKIKPFFQDNNFVLYRGNSLEILKLVPEESFDMVFADPPYMLSNNGFSVQAGKRVSVNKGKWDKSKGFEEDFKFQRHWIRFCKPLLKPDGTLWVSGTYHSIYQCGFALEIEGYHILNDICWYKPNAAPNLSCRYFAASHETLIWARKDEKAKHYFDYELMKNWKKNYKKIFNCSHKPKAKESIELLHKQGKQMRSVWAINTPKAIEKIFEKHPTQKPEDLLELIVLSSTKEKDIILDPFTGSSTTGIEAVKYGRKFIGIDMEEKYLNISIRRYKFLMKNIKNIHKTRLALQ